MHFFFLNYHVNSPYDYLITADEIIQVYNNNIIWHKEVPLKVDVSLCGCFSVTNSHDKQFNQKGVLVADAQICVGGYGNMEEYEPSFSFSIVVFFGKVWHVISNWL